LISQRARGLRQDRIRVRTRSSSIFATEDREAASGRATTSNSSASLSTSEGGGDPVSTSSTSRSSAKCSMQVEGSRPSAPNIAVSVPSGSTSIAPARVPSCANARTRFAHKAMRPTPATRETSPTVTSPCRCWVRRIDPGAAAPKSR